MINELHQLSVAMREENIDTDTWYREYKTIPKISSKAPCVRIVLSNGKVERLESVLPQVGSYIRKYGNNQGTFPAMNLAPLYRIQDEETNKALTKLLKNNGQGLEDLSVVKSWCLLNNWSKKFAKKYRISLEKIPTELSNLLHDEAAFEPIERLIQAVRPFSDMEVLHRALEERVFEMLAKKTDVVLALQILFYVGKGDKAPEEDAGNLSVIFDEDSLEDEGLSSIGIRFTKGFNNALLQAERRKQEAANKQGGSDDDLQDAFGLPFKPLKEPMPEVQLEGGLRVKLRTMFREWGCQYRYNRTENETYPIGAEMRQQLKNALEYIGSKEMKGKTWVNTGRKEILFVYPSKLPKAHASFTRQFQRDRDSEHQKARFEAEAQSFREYVTKTKETDVEHYPSNIQIFVIRQIDKARTKVVYTRCATPDEIIRCSDLWQKASHNLPIMPPPLSGLWTPFPFEVADIMNDIWRRDGKLASEKYKPVVSYHGMELLFNESRMMWETDLHRMAENSVNMAAFAGPLLNSVKGRNKNDPKDKVIWKVRDTLVFIGMLLYWLDVRKGDYMNEYPYLLGQMLKVSDSLHELYCHEVRKGEVPPQLIGSGLYVSASETPLQAFSQLAGRMNPYITWAKVNRDKRIVASRKDKDGNDLEYQGPTAGYLLSMYNRIANQLKDVLTEQNRFNDHEKALLFIGYLASYPKSERKDEKNDSINEDEMGGNDNEQ